ncbi:MAG: hypothetical protein WAU58_17630 [Terriglobales bacterium]
MQFHLETDELKLLANVLLELDPVKYNAILIKVMAHDLRLDAGELEDSAAALEIKKNSLKDEISREPNAARKAELERKLALLVRTLERVNEACVMF